MAVCHQATRVTPPTLEAMTHGRELTRRHLLLGAVTGVALASVVGCADASEPVSLAADPVRLESLGAELDLIAVYEATIAARPDLSAALTPILDQHREHAAALEVQDQDAPSPAPRAAAGAVDINGLRELERRAAGLCAGACVRAGNPELARLLALIGASEAQHVVVLAGVS